MPITQIVGFEDGNINRWSYYQSSIISGAAHSGNRGLSFSTGSSNLIIPLSTATAELYGGLWFYHKRASFGVSFRDSSNNTLVRLQINSSFYWEALRGSTVVATGTLLAPINDSWVNYQYYIKVADSGGRVVLKIDSDTIDIDFTGDTKPSTNTNIANLYFSGALSNIYLDDVVFSSGDYPGDIRIYPMVPDGDTADDAWTPSSGSDSYAMVDEVAASDSDYIYSGTNGQKVAMTLSNFDNTNLTPVAVAIIMRAKKDTANADKIKLGFDSGGTISTTDMTLTTSYSYFYLFFLNDPAGGSWSDSALDALKVYLESVLV